MVPSALVAPFVAVVGDRYRRERILLVVHLVRALACVGAAAALAAGSNTIVVYVLAVLAAVPLAAHRPSHLALAPLLARTPRELAASNVAALTFESGAVLLGPAVAALLLAVSGPCRGVRSRARSLSFLSLVAIAGVRPAASFEAPAARTGRAPRAPRGRALARRESARSPRRGAGRRAGVRPRRPRRPARRRRDRRPGNGRVGGRRPHRGIRCGRRRRRRRRESRSSAAGASAVPSGSRSPAGACRSSSSALWPETCGRRRVSRALGAREQPARRLGVHEHAGRMRTGGDRAHLRPVRARRHRDGRARLAPRTGRDRAARLARRADRRRRAPRRARGARARPLRRIDDAAEIRVAELELLRRTSIFAPLPYAALRRLAAVAGRASPPGRRGDRPAGRRGRRRLRDRRGAGRRSTRTARRSGSSGRTTCSGSSR